MPKFDMGAAWEDSVVLLRSHAALTGAIAAVFLFLPTLAVSWFGPAPIEPAPGASVDQIIETLGREMRRALPYQFLVNVIAAVGGVAILRLWLSRTGLSVGDAIVFALTAIPTVIVVQIAAGLAMGIGLILLIVPGLYLWARFSVVSPVIADRNERNPLTVLGDSWALTKDNGWRIFLFLFLVTLVIFVIALIATGVVAAVAGAGEGIGKMLTGLVEAAITALGAMVTLAVSAAIYRQLSVGASQDIFA